MSSKLFKRKSPLAEINVVPYIDVMLVLLVIFMITAPLMTQGVNVNLPQTSAKPVASSEKLPIVVSVDADGHYYLNLSDHPKQPVSDQYLLDRVAAILQIAKQNHENRPVYVKADKNANYNNVAQALVLLQKSGADQVGLITKPSHS